MHSEPSREPVLKNGSIGLLAGAILALIVQLGVPISSELADAIVTVVVLGAPVVVGLLNARSKVSPVEDSSAAARTERGRRR